MRYHTKFQQILGQLRNLRLRLLFQPRLQSQEIQQYCFFHHISSQSPHRIDHWVLCNQQISDISHFLLSWLHIPLQFSWNYSQLLSYVASSWTLSQIQRLHWPYFWRHWADYWLLLQILWIDWLVDFHSYCHISFFCLLSPWSFHLSGSSTDDYSHPIHSIFLQLHSLGG